VFSSTCRLRFDATAFSKIYLVQTEIIPNQHAINLVRRNLGLGQRKKPPWMCHLMTMQWEEDADENIL